MNQKHMGWISLQMQWGLNIAEGGKGGSGEERRGLIKQVFSSVNVCHHCLKAPCLLSRLTQSHPQRGRTGSSLPELRWGPWASPAGVRLRGSWTHPAPLRRLSRMPGRSSWKVFLWSQCFAAHPRLLKWGDTEEGWARESAGCHTQTGGD